jgi:hypothetical protein
VLGKTAGSILAKAEDASGHNHDEKGRFAASSSAEHDTLSVIKSIGDFYEKQGVKAKNNDFKTIESEGRFHEVAPLPKGVKLGEARLCFMNAYNATQANPKLRYAEGYAHMGAIPLHHAWALDEKNRVVDPTWPEREVPLEGRAYYGVAMDPKKAFKRMTRHGTYGVYFKGDETDNHLGASEKEKTVGSILEKVADPAGHYHDEKGRFAPKSAASSGVPEHIINATHGKSHFVMTGGGPGSGKGARVAAYVGGRTSGNYVDFGPGVSTQALQNQISRRKKQQPGGTPRLMVNLLGEKPKVRAMKTEALPGFSEDRVVDPDREKKELTGMYVEGDKSGRRGPQGAKSMEDFHGYDEEYKAGAMRELKELGYSSLEHFTSEHPGWLASGGNPGGLTHEISSVKSKRRMDEMLATPHEGSLIYDSVGGNPRKMRDYALKALKNGYGDVTLDYAHAPLAVSHENDSLRSRVTGAGNVINGAERARKGYETFSRWARFAQRAGMPIHVTHTQMASPRRIAGTAERGASRASKSRRRNLS